MMLYFVTMWFWSLFVGSANVTRWKNGPDKEVQSTTHVKSSGMDLGNKAVPVFMFSIVICRYVVNRWKTKACLLALEGGSCIDVKTWSHLQFQLSGLCQNHLMLYFVWLLVTSCILFIYSSNHELCFISLLLQEVLCSPLKDKKWENACPFGFNVYLITC